MGAERNAVRCYCAQIIVSLAIIVEICAVRPAIALAQAQAPSTETPTIQQSKPLISPNDADAKIHGLLQQMVTAIETGHTAAPASGSAVEMLSLALALLPLASPDGANMMANFPLALKQRAESEAASQRPETQMDFLVFAKLVSSLLASNEHANQTDTPESADALSPGIPSSESVSPRQETIPEAKPATRPALPGIPRTDKVATSLPSRITPLSNGTQAAQPELSNTTLSPEVGAEQTAVGSQPTPSPSVRAAPAWQTSPSASETRALLKTAEAAKSAGTIPPALSDINSDQRPYPLPTKTVQVAQSGASKTRLRTNQPQGPSQDFPPLLTGASNNQGVPPVQQSGHDQAASGSQDTSAKDAAGHVTARASFTAPDATSRVLELALARPAGNPQTAPAPKTLEQHPGLPPQLVRSLVQRGDGMISLGDISGARRLYALAADEGDGDAATKLGDTYNPEFLSGHGVQGLQPDLNTAERWYRKAMKLGDPEAAKHLTTLTSLR